MNIFDEMIMNRKWLRSICDLKIFDYGGYRHDMLFVAEGNLTAVRSFLDAFNNLHDYNGRILRKFCGLRLPDFDSLASELHKIQFELDIHES